jgi:protein arginine kinase activator
MNLMTCQLCGKHNATIYFKGIVDDHTVKMHLCEVCAKKKGMSFPFGKSTLSLSEMVAGLAASSKLGGALLSLTCRNCGMNYAEFRQTTQFGCSQCYTTFAPLIGPLVKKVQGSAQHIGKQYRRTVRPGSAIQELAKLKIELKDAIRREAFEQAAMLRDQIQTLEQSMGASPKPLPKTQEPSA